MSNYAIIDQNGNVISVILWNGETGWTPPTDCTAIQSDVAVVGGTYSDGVFYPPANPLIAPALDLLTKSDTTMHRITEAVCLGLNLWTNPDVVTFVDYRRALRDIVNGTDTTSVSLPAPPTYPTGT
jgi:hypothetical protein